jgi:hypothetical protein
VGSVIGQRGGIAHDGAAPSYLSDRLGCKQVYIFGAVTTELFAFAYYALLDTAVPG